MTTPTEVFLNFLERQPAQIKERYVAQLCLFFCDPVEDSSAASFMPGAPPIEPFQSGSRMHIPSFEEEWSQLKSAIKQSHPMDSLRQIIKVLGVMDYLILKDHPITEYELASLAERTNNADFLSIIPRLTFVDAMHRRFVQEWRNLRTQDLSLEELARTEATLL